MRIAILVGAILLLIQCTHTIENPTKDFEAPKKLSALSGKKMKEISGIAASRANPGYLWGHNDSGNDPEVFLFDKNLKIALTCKLQGVENRDWEDIVIGPGPESGKNYIYIGDIGDNKADYKYKYVYRFEEPALAPGNSELEITDFDTLVFTLSDKKKDTETLLIDPATRDLLVVSKREEPVWVYRIKTPAFNGDTLVATPLISLPYTQIVGGDISIDGKKILMKNYEHVYYWNNTAAKPLIEILAEKPYEVPYEIEPQGEAIAWDPALTGFYTLSEKNVGKDSYLFFYPAK
jgi:hypothetical protein